MSPAVPMATHLHNTFPRGSYCWARLYPFVSSFWTGESVCEKYVNCLEHWEIFSMFLFPLCTSFFLIFLVLLNLMLVHVQTNFSVHRIFVLARCCQKPSKTSVAYYYKHAFLDCVSMGDVFAQGSAGWLGLAVSGYSCVRFSLCASYCWI